MFNKIKFGRNQIIGVIFFLIVLVTAISMFRISYNENIIDSYEGASKTLPSRTKIGMMDSFWQKYTGGTRNNSVSAVDARNARRTIDTAYSFMIGADAVLVIAAAALIIQPLVANRLKKK